MNERAEPSKREAIHMLEKTSRTFFIPISRLVPELQEAVASAYLCMRALDEIEDHPELPNKEKSELLRSIGSALEQSDRDARLELIFHSHKDRLPEVTLRLEEWAKLCPAPAVPRILASVSEMAGRMAGWVERNWKIRTEEDLDDYTYSVAGLVGIMLTDLWKWHSGIECDYQQAVAFGRGLQAVNIIRNRTEDLGRGVDFYPEYWELDRMLDYSRRHLKQADAYADALPDGPILEFCRIPLVLAHATLEEVESGGLKLSRSAVMKLVQQITSGCSTA
jgi:farnesyl-diphosphate farnesyltransferase